MATPSENRKKQLVLHVNEDDEQLIRALIARSGISKAAMIRLALRALYRDFHEGTAWKDKAPEGRDYDKGTQTVTGG
jgi:hypothetical protein